MAFNNPAQKQNPPSYEDISRRARELWEIRGQPAGQDDAIWLEAERELRRQAAPATATQPPGSSRPAATPKPSSRLQRREAEELRGKGAEVSTRGSAMREPDDGPDI